MTHDYSGFTKKDLVDTWFEIIRLDWSGRSDMLHAECTAIRKEFERREHAQPQDIYLNGEWFGGWQLRGDVTHD